MCDWMLGMGDMKEGWREGGRDGWTELGPEVFW